jgi:hypothetical protein
LLVTGIFCQAISIPYFALVLMIFDAGYRPGSPA